jgi:glycerol transport system substrate-binding protein
MTGRLTRRLLLTASAATLSASAALAGPEEARRWIDSEFQPSTLSKEEQMKEMEWFINAAKPFQNIDVNVVSETITTHEYEARTLARAFTEITGIRVKHDLIQEGDVVEKIQTQMQSGRNIYDAWINDSDLIGTHFRYQQAVPLSDFMAARARTSPTPTSTSRTLSAAPSPRRPTARCTSFPTSSSRTCTGSATTGSPAPTSRSASRPSTATTSACP